MKCAATWSLAVSAATLLGCAGEQLPKADPNFKPATDPSALTVPDQMKRAGSPAPPPPPAANPQ